MTKTTQRFIEVFSILASQNGYTDKRMCESFGMKANSYSNIKNGTANATIGMITQLLDAYKDVNGHYILTGRGEMFFGNKYTRKEEKTAQDEVLGVIAAVLEQNNELIRKINEQILKK